MYSIFSSSHGAIFGSGSQRFPAFSSDHAAPPMRAVGRVDDCIDMYFAYAAYFDPHAAW